MDFLEDKFGVKTFAQQIELDESWMKKLSFTSIMTCSNLMQTMFTKTLKGLTSKQWLLLIITSSMPEPPTLSEVASAMGCSRQNVKQLTEILRKNEYLVYTKAAGDRNTVRLSVTDKWWEYCKDNGDMAAEGLESIFKGFSREELQQFLNCFIKLTDNLENLNGSL